VYYRNNKDEITSHEPEPMWRIQLVSEMDNLTGFTDNGTIYLRRSGSDAATRVHEALHVLSDHLTGHAWRKRLGMVMEEAAAEYLTAKICAEFDLRRELNGYYNNVKLLEAIMKFGKVSDAMLLEAYLGGTVGPVIAAIKRISGEEGLNVLLTVKDRTAYDTYNAWAAGCRRGTCASSPDRPASGAPWRSNQTAEVQK
jgi:hypothetical protein